ncbi:hypothetical protein Cni_G20576 [Canna indica]|uniref:Uncharacterized protein n=1 Tax=Canna indica TaxID=4628 RepID=A0AAQ3KQ70_9LILI|nr:hypothetical protein Cni_G20576 [Canna indica]
MAIKGSSTTASSSGTLALIRSLTLHMAPTQANLGKVGREAFAMIEEEYFGRRGSRQPSALRSFHYSNNTPTKKEPMLDSIQAAKEFHGDLFVRYSRPKLIPTWETYRRFGTKGTCY